MKIVHICLIGTFTDGRNYQENMLSKFHRQFGADVTVLTSRWIQCDNGKPHVLDTRDTYIDDNGVKIIRLPMKGKEYLYKKIKRYKGVYETLEREAPDLVFIHGVASVEIAAVVKYLKKHPNVRSWADNHADFSNSATNWLSRRILHGIIWKHYAKKLVPVVEKFYGVLPARVDFLVDVYGLPREKCELLVMGADDDRVEAARDPAVTAAVREEYGVAPDDFLIITGGKIDAWKTQTLLLMEAVRDIPDPKVKLIVFGSVTPDLTPRVEALADGKKVQYIGWVQAMDTYRYFAASDLVVFPGRHSVFWEQVAAQGVPMLCKDWKGTHHVDVGGNVEFLTQDNSEEIKAAILRLREDPAAYDAMKHAAETKGMETFSYNKIARRCIGMEDGSIPGTQAE